MFNLLNVYKLYYIYNDLFEIMLDISLGISTNFNFDKIKSKPNTQNTIHL